MKISLFLIISRPPPPILSAPLSLPQAVCAERRTNSRIGRKATQRDDEFEMREVTRRDTFSQMPIGANPLDSKETRRIN